MITIMNLFRCLFPDNHKEGMAFWLNQIPMLWVEHGVESETSKFSKYLRGPATWQPKWFDWQQSDGKGEKVAKC